MTSNSDSQRSAAHGNQLVAVGRIQSFGSILVADENFQIIKYASANIHEYWGAAVGEVCGKSTKDVLGRETVHAVANKLSRGSTETQREYLSDTVTGRPDCQFSIIKCGPEAILECVRKPVHADTSSAVVQAVLSVLDARLEGGEVAPLLQEISEELRAILRVDQVAFLRAVPDGAGDVIAEARHPGVSSMLGARVPPGAWPSARQPKGDAALIRFIADVEDAGLEVMAGAREDSVDLTPALLRGVDEGEKLVLKELGFRAAILMPIVVDGAHWGDFVCHSVEPLEPDPVRLASIELLGRLFGSKMEHVLQQRRQKHLANIRNAFENDAMDQIVADLKAVIACDGIAYCDGGLVVTNGDAPPIDVINKLRASITSDARGHFALSNLKMRMPGFGVGQTGGMLVVQADGPRSVSLLFFRNMVEVKASHDIPSGWRKATNDYLAGLRRRSDDWTADDIETAKEIATILGHDPLAPDVRERHPSNGMTPRELNHRVRNLLALVQSLSHRFHSANTTALDASEAMEGRIQALASAHNLLTRHDASAVRLIDLIASEPRVQDKLGKRMDISGPPVTLSYEAVPVMSLVVHELMSNALRHGALSRPDGKVSVFWSVQKTQLKLFWKEISQLAQRGSSLVGFGHTVVAEAIPYELGGSSEVRWNANGIEVEVGLPRRVFQVSADADYPVVHSEGQKNEQLTAYSPMKSQRILVVEDSYVVAKFAQQIMWDEGAAVVDLVPSVDEAKEILDRNAYDFCLLDVNLRGEMSTDIASKLKQKNIPFAFSTGYGSDAGTIAKDFDVPQLNKPIDLARLRAVVRQELKDD